MNDENSLKISIIIPVYNSEKYLKKCLDSIVNQTYKNLEIIIVNDGSTDGSEKICKEYESNDDRVIYLYKENGGLPSARNMGLEHASGDYIGYVDSDDYCELDMFEYLITKAVENNADVARCSFFFEYENNGKTEEVIYEKENVVDNKDEQITDLLLNGHLSGVVWNKIYKFDKVKNIRFDSKYSCNEDLDYNYKVFSSGVKAVYCTEPKYRYYIHNGSITMSKFSDGAFDVLRLKRKILLDFTDNENVYRQAVKGYIISAFVVLSGVITRTDNKTAYKKIKQSIFQYKKYVLFGKEYSVFQKIKFILLWFAPFLYRYLIIKKNKRGN